MYIPLAAHKNELVMIDSMETFSHYFCLATRQKMSPVATGAVIRPVGELEEEREHVPVFEGTCAETADDDDEL